MPIEAAEYIDPVFKGGQTIGSERLWHGRARGPGVALWTVDLQYVLCSPSRTDAPRDVDVAIYDGGRDITCSRWLGTQGGPEVSLGIIDLHRLRDTLVGFSTDGIDQSVILDDGQAGTRRRHLGPGAPAAGGRTCGCRGRRKSRLAGTASSIVGQGLQQQRQENDRDRQQDPGHYGGAPGDRHTGPAFRLGKIQRGLLDRCPVQRLILIAQFILPEHLDPALAHGDHRRFGPRPHL